MQILECDSVLALSIIDRMFRLREDGIIICNSLHETGDVDCCSSTFVLQITVST